MYEVVFEGKQLGMDLLGAEDPRDFPSVSSPPAGKDLPKQGHLIVSVNGYHLQGSPDTYAKAVEIITSAGRPVIIGFQDPADSSNDSFGLVGGGGGSGDSLDWKQGSAGAALLANGGGVSGMEGLTPSQRVHALFDLLDTNKDGVLTKAEVIGGAPQLKMSLFDAANMFDQLDVNKDGVLERAEFVSLVPEAREEELKKMSRARRKTMQQAGEVGLLPLGLSKVLGVESDPTQQTLTPFQQQPSAAAASSSSQPKGNQVLGPRVRPQFKASDVELFEDGSYAVTFRGGKGKGHFALPPLGFKLVEAPKKAIAPRVDLTGYAATPPTPHKDGNGKANQKLGGWPLAGHQVVAVEGAPVELDGVQDCFARCVKLVEDACNGDSRQSLSPVGCVVVTFKPLPLDEAAAAAAASEFLDDDDDDEGGGGKGTQELDLRPGLDDDEASGGEEEGQGAVTTGLWSGEDGFGTAPMEVDLEEGMYAVQFSTLDLLMKLMENVDRRQLPVVAKAFPGASLMQRGHLLMSVNGKAVDDKRSAKHEPFTTTLDLLAALQAPPVTLEFARPAPVAKISAVAGVPGLYDAVFEHENLGVDLSAFGRQGRVVRISGTHPIGVPHLGDQVVAVNGVGLLDLAERIESGKLLPQDGSKKQTKDVLSFVQRFVSGDKAVRPLTLRMQRSTGEMAAGEEAAEARRGFSVLFMSQSLGLSFDLKTGVPVVDDIRPMFTAPRQGDVLTAINGAELSKCALTVPQLALMLRALPRPVKLSFVDGSKALQDAPKATSARGEGALKYPKHHLRQVLVPAGKSVGLKLMTISSRPVVQAVLSKALVDQGLLPCDVLVTIDGKHVGDTSAVECASMLAQARQAADDETAKASRASRVKRTRAVKLGVLRMAPMDRDSSYNSQHPIDIAAALTSYDSTSKVGQLSFSLPNYIPTDKYKVEVYRYGSQVAPMMSHGSHERDHYIRYTRAVGVDLQQSGGRFAAEKKDSR